MTVPETIEKVCTRCGETKPGSDFYILKSGPKKGTLRSECKECQIQRVRANQFKRRKADPEGFLRTQREIVARHRKAGRDASSRLSAEAYDSAITIFRKTYPAAFKAILRQERYKRGLNLD